MGDSDCLDRKEAVDNGRTFKNLIYGYHKQILYNPTLAPSLQIKIHTLSLTLGIQHP